MPFKVQAGTMLFLRIFSFHLIQVPCAVRVSLMGDAIEPQGECSTPSLFLPDASMTDVARRARTEMFGGPRPVGVAVAKYKQKRGQKLETMFVTFPFYGGVSQAVAEHGALECCRQKYQKHMMRLKEGAEQVQDCRLFRPAGRTSEKCKFRLGMKLGANHCVCPKDRPHLLSRAENGTEQLLRHAPNTRRFQFNEDAASICVDECFVRSERHSEGSVIHNDPSQASSPGFYNFYNPASEPSSSLETGSWPVIFLAVYTLGAVVHSNLVFCPLSVLEGHHSPCIQPGFSQQPCETWHTKSFRRGPTGVPALLIDHRCRELIWDGNEGGNIWTPPQEQTGCWAQGESPKEFLLYDGGRERLGYPTLYWLTSENTISPAGTTSNSVKSQLSQCFSSNPDLGYRLDFNPGTYSLLHHNCNKFSTEAMRYLDLPKFYPKDRKGKHKHIALSATDEESSVRTVFRPLVNNVAIHAGGGERSMLSSRCKSEFFTRAPNCRRVAWSYKGDCPVHPDFKNVLLRCYNPSLAEAKVNAGYATKVHHHEKVNGVCGIPLGQRCSKDGVPPCQPGANCEQAGDVFTCQSKSSVKEYQNSV